MVRWCECVLREASVNTIYEMWTRLNELYETKDLLNKVYLGEKFFTFKKQEMNSSKFLYENLDKFKKVNYRVHKFVGEDMRR